MQARSLQFKPMQIGICIKKTVRAFLNQIAISQELFILKLNFMEYKEKFY